MSSHSYAHTVGLHAYICQSTVQVSQCVGNKSVFVTVFLEAYCGISISRSQSAS